MERGNVINFERCRNHRHYIIFAADWSWCHWHSNMLLFIFELHYRYWFTFIIYCKRIYSAVLLLSLKYLIWHKIAERRACKPVTGMLENTVSELTAGSGLLSCLQTFKCLYADEKFWTNLIPLWTYKKNKYMAADRKSHLQLACCVPSLHLCPCSLLWAG